MHVVILCTVECVMFFLTKTHDTCRYLTRGIRLDINCELYYVKDLGKRVCMYIAHCNMDIVMIIL